MVNVLKDARETFDPIPLYGVMGGFHLSGSECEAIIPETIEDLKRAADIIFRMCQTAEEDIVYRPKHRVPPTDELRKDGDLGSFTDFRLRRE